MVYSAMVGYPFLSNANISAPTASFTYHYFSYTVRAPHYIIRESYKYSRLKTAYFSCLALISLTCLLVCLAEWS